jgi:ubiquinone/menaquinone biosynthesis C-methylase UbiE
MSRREYFDTVAQRWDGWNDRENMGPRLSEGLRRFELRPDEQIVDLGCGTGILLQHLLEVLGDEGRVVAVDFSSTMLELAARKIADSRVRFEQAEATALPVEDAAMDRVLCFSTWPHFPRPEEVLRELWRVLKPGGSLQIWHVAGRETINGIHQGVGGLIAEDLLLPVEELAEQARGVGFEVEAQIDEADEYLLSLRKRA